MTPHPVLAELQTRRDGGARTGRLALAIEGGGMRGVVSGGMVVALEALGYGPHLFDAVFGSSAGSINGAYFISGQAARGVTVYYENLTGHDFIDVRRAVTRRPLLDLGYLFNHVMTVVKPLDVARVLGYPHFHPLATNAVTGEKKIFTCTTDPDVLRGALRASATIPWVAGGPCHVEDEDFFDASLVEAIPWETPRAMGFDYVLALSTRALGVADPRTVLQRVAQDAWTHRAAPALRHVVEDRMATGAQRADELTSRTRTPLAGPYVCAICPSPTDPTVPQLTRDPLRLVAGVKSGYLSALRALGHEAPLRFTTVDSFQGIFTTT